MKQGGSFFSVDVVDNNGDDLTVTFFGDAAKKFSDMFRVHGVYRFLGGQLRPNKRTFNKTNSDFQLVFDQTNSIISELDFEPPQIEETHEPPEFNTDLRMNQQQPAQIDTMPDLRTIEFIHNQGRKGEIIDIIAFVKEVKDSENVNYRNGSSGERRMVFLYDDTNDSIELVNSCYLINA